MRLHKMPIDYVAHLGLSSDTRDFLTTVGLPIELYELEHSIEINFYPDRERIVKSKFKGRNYIIIGDDSGTQLTICLDDNHVYSIDFNNLVPIDPICFVNSRIDKFVESIRCFIEFKAKAGRREQSESRLIQLMKEQLRNIDKKALDPGTWWTQIINDTM
jgi:hypothetical protein